MSNILRVNKELYREAQKLQREIRKHGISITMEEAYWRVKTKKKSSMPDWMGRFDFK